MAAIAQQMARTLDLALGAEVVRLRRTADSWKAELANGHTIGTRVEGAALSGWTAADALL